MMNKKRIAVIGLITVTLGIYLFVANGDKNEQIEVAKNIQQLVHNYSVGSIEAQSASITSSQLIVTNTDASEEIYDLLEDDFFVSIAPYIETTHPCSNHSLTGCRGEMAEEEFAVLIEDTQGNVIIDQTFISQANGFIDFWLPRDRTYRVTIAHDGKSQESEISTFLNDNTCITTMQLI